MRRIATLARRLVAMLGAVALVASVCACDPAPPTPAQASLPAAAPATPVPAAASAPAVDPAYRAQVIAYVGRVGPKAPETARAAYAAIDGGEISPDAIRLGGIAPARELIRKFETVYEIGKTRECLATHFGSAHFSPAYVAALVDSAGFDALVADAQRLARSGYDAQLAAATEAPTQETRARAAITALMTHEPQPSEPGLEYYTMLATSHMARATGGACAESPEFLALMDAAR